MSFLARYAVPLLAVAAGVAAVSLHLGCSGTPATSGPTTVRGRVTFQGRPVEGAMVVFAPDHDRGGSGKPIRAETGEGGLFQIAAVPAGWYRVAIAPPADASAELASFPPQLRRPDSSTLLREIASGQDHVFEFAIEVPSHGAN